MSEMNGATSWSLVPSHLPGGKTRIGLLHDQRELLSDVVNLQSQQARCKLAAKLHEELPAIGKGEFEQELQSLATAAAARAGKAPAMLRPVVSEDALLTTDIGNARRLAELHGRDIRYVVGIGWHCWDGRRWARDEHRRIDVKARGVASSFLRDAASLVGSAKSAELARHAIASASRQRIDAALHLARSEEGVSILAEALDADPMLLNVENGTLDLRTGELRAHRREDLISKIAPVRYDPAATCPVFDAFLAEIQPDEATRSFVQRLLGYSLTGQISEHVLPVLWGSGSNGKSTLQEVVLSLLGDYGAPVPSELLLAAHGDRHPTEMARLQGLRLAVAHESDQGRRLAEGKVKQLTGGDRISARRMREDFFEFRPTHKVFLVSNHKPEVRGSDEGIWRRVLLVPFAVHIPAERRDRSLGERLHGELSGILNRLLAGCLEWQRHGLAPPTSVTAATTEYRAEQDLLADWLEECCERGTELRSKPIDLWTSYRSFHGGSPPLKQRGFYDALGEQGITPSRNYGGRWRIGVALRNKGFPADADHDA